jgi:hypothetical protein
MIPHEIPPAQWRGFLDQFSRDHRAWLATLERGAGQIDHIEVFERPLDSVAPHTVEGRIVSIVIRFQHDLTAEPVMRVESPVILRVDEGVAGSAPVLEIEAKNGQRTRIRFRASPPLEALDGLAPGEL